MKDQRVHIAFVAAVPGYNVFNRKSAIDSILCSLLLELANDFYITVNGEDFIELKKKHFSIMEKPLTALSSTSFIKSMIPYAVKMRIKEKRLVREQEKLQEQLKKQVIAPDLVFELYKYGSSLGKALATHFNVPLLLYYDAPEVEQYSEIHRVKPVYGKAAREAETSTVKAAQAVVVYSHPVKDYLVKNTGTQASKFHVYQTLDYTRLSFDTQKQKNDRITIGYIGSFMRWHKVSRLVKMFERLCSEGHAARLLLVGAGETYEEVKEQVGRCSFATFIEMPGFVDGKTLEGLKQKLDIGIMPGSQWYNIPTKVFEYGAAHVASLAPHTPTIDDIFVDGQNILLFDDKDDEQMYAALKKLVSDEAFREKLAMNLNTAIKTRFTSQQAVQFYKGLISSLVS